MTDYSRFDSHSSAPAGLMSLAVHACVVMLLFTVLSNPVVQVTVKKAGRVFMPVIAAYLPEKTLPGGGGGGDRSLTEASMGRAPKFAARPFVPPAVVVNNANPKLLIEPALLGPPDVQTPNNTMAVWGDPLAKIGPPSSGTGSGGGIGSGKNGGIGPGDGAGFGPGQDGGMSQVYVAGGGVSAPALTFQVDPEYSEEARKAKYSGVVVLSIEVDQSGHTRNLRVAKGVGLGLDEKAIEAVKQWRFKPGLKNGKPVIVRAQVEVNFRLL